MSVDQGATDGVQTQETETAPQDTDALVAQRVDEALRPIKTNLDKAYAARDAALARVQEFEKKQREAELQRLQEEGKHKEAYELQLAERDAKNKELLEHNIRLTRDMETRAILSTVAFRSDKAAKMAFSDIVGELVQNDKGEWTHKSGAPLKDFVKAFIEHEDNAFLLKPKVNSGSGSQSGKPSTTTTGDKSLFQMSQADVLKLAHEGRLPKRK